MATKVKIPKKMSKTSTSLHEQMRKTSNKLSAQTAQNRLHAQMRKTSASLSNSVGTGTAKKTSSASATSARMDAIRNSVGASTGKKKAIKKPY